MELLQLETTTLWSALIFYSLLTAIAFYALVFRKRPERFIFSLIFIGVALHTVAFVARWIRIEHLPVGNAFEMLSANIWGLMLAILIAYWRLPKLRHFVALAMPMIIMLMAWMLLIPTTESSLPPTYDTIWLFIHIGFIKLFLGCAFVALALSGVILLRDMNIGVKKLSNMPDNLAIDMTIYRCMALALIFDTLGVVAGSIWAQDAWGHYWSWDPLEVWSLVTWLAVGLSLHVRKPFKTSPKTNALLVVAVWLIAFFTFFGIPFVSETLHKGAI